jgi:thiopeptide-type bacteriocin biosynthesis protein
MATWVSAYIYYTKPLNQLLTGCVYPFVVKHSGVFDKESPYFFIRYPEGGDHIRLRIKTDHEKEVMQLLSGHVAEFNQDARLAFVAYEPEIKRYGDANSIQWAEQLFYYSSAAALEWLQVTADPPASASIQCLQMHLQLLHATGYSITQQLDLCDYFIEDWIRVFHPQRKIPTDKALWLETFDKAFRNNRERITYTMRHLYNSYAADTDASAWLQASKRVMAQYRQSPLTDPQIREAISSILHMTHNRLGIENNEEAYIMYCTKECLKNIREYDKRFSL